MRLPIYNPSASALDRVSQCPPSHVIGPRAEETSDKAERGTEIHEFLRKASKDPANREIYANSVPLEWRRTCANLDLDTALAGLTVLGTEEAYCVDAATGDLAYLGSNIERGYNAAMQKLCKRDLKSSEFCASLDIEAMRDKTPVALDWKTGQRNKAPGDMWQMKLQCYSLWVKYMSDSVIARVVYIAEDGGVWAEEHEFAAMDLADVPAELRAIRTGIEAAALEGTPTVYPGEHCVFCPALMACPSKTAMIRNALLDLSDLDEQVGALTLEQVGVALIKVSQISKIAEKVEKSLKQIVTAQGEVPADPGYVYRVLEGSRQYMPPDLTRGLLVRLGATTEDIADITRTSKFPKITRVKATKGASQ